jgi:CubicO group peptidase (beta-lactamase class C family)
MKNLLFTLLFLPSLSKAQRSIVSRFDSLMQAEVAAWQFNGCVLVAQSGNVIYQKPFGYRNYTTKEPLDNNSVFELASISKQFTAMGILLLKEKGKLDLSDTLRKFFPELPYHNITIRHMLTHTSGLPIYGGVLKNWQSNRIAFNQDVIDHLSKEKPPLLFEPGEKWQYSNTAFVLLASIIEKVSGKSFKEYMELNIFRPLKMQYSRVYNTRRSGETIPNYAYGYVYSDSLNRYILPDSLAKHSLIVHLDGVQGDRIINSTTGDLLKWDRALKNHTLLSKALQKEMLSPQVALDTASHLYQLTQTKYYGYGIGVGEDKYGSYIRHGGSWPGYWTEYIRYIDKDITIIILSNNRTNSSVNILKILEGLAGITIDK